MKEHAYRNLKLCSKDCLCLFVCPTGAADNETGQIDFETCIGCGACARACPSHAITMIPNKMPPQKKKEPEVIKTLSHLLREKVEIIRYLKNLLDKTEIEEEKRLYKTFIHSERVMAEDLAREAGYMLPQSNNTHELLLKLKNNKEKEEEIEKLLEKLEVNDKEGVRV